jgi:choline dehydrogenase-like flavoprotein
MNLQTALIVGTGPAALAASLALRRQNIPFEVLDVSFDLEPARQTATEELSRLSPDEWPDEHAKSLFPAPSTSARGGVEKRYIFGSGFPYARHRHLTIQATDCTVDLSHGLGGFGNVWGAAILPYNKNEISDWPISFDSLAQSYRNVADFAPTSGEQDELESAFPLYDAAKTSLRQTEQTRMLMAALSRRRANLQRDGVNFGRARVAVDSSGGETTCRYCGYCLDGCVYGSIFSPRLHWRRLEAEGVKIHRGQYVLQFREGDQAVTVDTIDVNSGNSRQWTTSRLFLGAGTLGTTRLTARSLGVIDTPIRILDSQYFFFPLLSYKAAADITQRFTLAEAFVEVLNPRVSSRYVHFQLYGLNRIFRQTLRGMVPSPLRGMNLTSPIERRFYLVQGFLHSGDSGYLEMTLRNPAPDADTIHMKGVLNPAAKDVARRAQALLRRHLAAFGLIPPAYLAMVPPGRSFHAGGSFPMGAAHPTFSSDTLGRPAGLQRVHIVDASAFPSIPATTITLTAMANADRIVNASVSSGVFE